MKKIKERIEEFKAKPKKDKIRKIADIVFLATLIAILFILIVGFFVYKGNKNEKAGADYRPSMDTPGFMYPEINNPVVKIKINETWNAKGQIAINDGEFLLGQEKALIMYDFVASEMNPYRCNVIYKIKIYDGQAGKDIELIDGKGEVRYIIPVSIEGSNVKVENVYAKKSNGKLINIGNGTMQDVWIAKIANATYSHKEVESVIKMLWAVSFSEVYEEYYRCGYNKGKIDGIASVPTGFDPVGIIIEPVAKFLNIKLFGDFGIGHFLLVAVAVSITLIFLKIFAGG